jgi:hypothetical protein
LAVALTVLTVDVADALTIAWDGTPDEIQLDMRMR